MSKHGEESSLSQVSLINAISMFCERMASANSVACKDADLQLMSKQLVRSSLLLGFFPFGALGRVVRQGGLGGLVQGRSFRRPVITWILYFGACMRGASYEAARSAASFSDIGALVLLGLEVGGSESVLVRLWALEGRTVILWAFWCKAFASVFESLCGRIAGSVKGLVGHL